MGSTRDDDGGSQWWWKLLLFVGSHPHTHTSALLLWWEKMRSEEQIGALLFPFCLAGMAGRRTLAMDNRIIHNKPWYSWRDLVECSSLALSRRCRNWALMDWVLLLELLLKWSDRRRGDMDRRWTRRMIARQRTEKKLILCSLFYIEHMAVMWITFGRRWGYRLYVYTVVQ